MASDKWFVQTVQPRIYKPSQDVQDALRFFRTRITEIKDARSHLLERWDKDENLFRSQMSFADKAEWQSDLFIPRTYGLVMAALAQLAINKPDISINPTNKFDAFKIPYVKAALHQNWLKNNGNKEFLFGFLDALKLGIAHMEVGFRSNKRDINEIVDYDPITGKIESKPETIIEFDDVFFEFFRPQDYYQDNYAAWTEDAVDSARRYIFPYDRFKKLYGDYPGASFVIPGKVEYSHESEDGFGPFTIEERIRDNEVELFRYFNKENDTMWTIANGVLLASPDNPIPFHDKELPFVDIKPSPWDKYTYVGASLPRLVEDLQEEENSLRNMVHDQTHLNIFSPFLYSADEDINEDLLVMEPGVGVPVTDPQNIQFFKQQQVGGDAYRLLNLLDDDIQQVTGIDPRFQGLPQGGTATETTILKEMTLAKLNLMLRFIEDSSMSRFAELWGDKIQQFYFKTSEAEKKEIRERKGVREALVRQVQLTRSLSRGISDVQESSGFLFADITEDKIRGKFDWNVKIGASIGISKELTKAAAVNFFKTFNGNPRVNQDQLLQDVFELNEKDPEQYMTTLTAVDERVAIMLAEEQNKQIIAGQEEVIIPELVTVKHITVHQALLESEELDKMFNGAQIKKRLGDHIIKEIRLKRTEEIKTSVQRIAQQKQMEQGGVPGGVPASESQLKDEKLGSLTQSRPRIPGLPKAATTEGQRPGELSQGGID